MLLLRAQHLEAGPRNQQATGDLQSRQRNGEEFQDQCSGQERDGENNEGVETRFEGLPSALIGRQTLGDGKEDGRLGKRIDHGKNRDESKQEVIEQFHDPVLAREE